MFRSRHRVWTIRMDSGHWAAACERCGSLGPDGSEVYAAYLVAIHVGNYPS
jgi:hypothetical protein